MAIVRWDPFREMMTLRNSMDRVFEDSILRRLQTSPENGDGYMAMDVHQTDDAIIVTSAMPGVKPDDVDIAITGETVTIKGETRQEEEVKEDNYLLKERQYGTYSRTLQMPVQIQGDKAEATFEDGILTLTLPKAEEVKPKQIKVQAKPMIEGKK
jgi:HSP20 family protein